MTGPSYGSEFGVNPVPGSAPQSPLPDPASAYGSSFAMASPPIRRPGVVTLAAVAVGFVAGLEFTQVALSLSMAFMNNVGFLWYGIGAVVVKGLLALSLLVVMFLLLRGLDSGRIMAVALSGAACWQAIGWLSSAGTWIARGDFPDSWGYLLSLLLVLPGGLAGAAAIVMLASSAASEWFHRKRACQW
ncbi:MAG: hypothetical protein GEU94_16375 [Micromonosporaceae bacterium]|nr:hypothetical protein [Micromonosporaceae bacterium]